MQPNDIYVVDHAAYNELMRGRIAELAELNGGHSKFAARCGKDRQTIENAVCPKRNQKHSSAFIADLCHGASISLRDFYAFDIPLCALNKTLKKQAGKKKK